MDWLLPAARGLHFVAVLQVAGLWLFWPLVAEPALRAAAGGERWFAERARLHVLARRWTVLAVAAGLAQFVLQARAMGGGALSLDVLWLTLGTGFGTAAALRAGLLLVLIAAAGRLGGGTALALGLVALGSLAWGGHAAAGLGWEGRLHLAADLAHLFAAACWLGGLLPLARLLGLARAGAGTGLAVVAVRRFSLLGMAAVAALLLTGGVAGWILVGGLPGLVGTPYGLVLLAKTALVAAMLGLAAVNRAVLTPRLTAKPAVGALRRNARAEWALGVVVVAAAGLLGTMTPARHDRPWWPVAWRLDAGGAVAAAAPTSFFPSPVAHEARVVAAGHAAYEAQCRSCHPAPPPLPAGIGDAYWAVRHLDRPASRAEAAADREGWSIAHFLLGEREFAEASPLGPATGIGGPPAPDFDFETADGDWGALSSLLADGAVLLVLADPADPVSAERLEQLRARAKWFAGKGVAVVALAEADEAGAPVVFAAPEVAAVYRRMAPAGGHAEFLVDRAGVLRARWQPDDLLDWRNSRLLAAQIAPLAGAVPGAGHRGH